MYKIDEIKGELKKLIKEKDYKTALTLAEVSYNEYHDIAMGIIYERLLAYFGDYDKAYDLCLDIFMYENPKIKTIFMDMFRISFENRNYIQSYETLVYLLNEIPAHEKKLSKFKIYLEEILGKEHTKELSIQEKQICNQMNNYSDHNVIENTKYLQENFKVSKFNESFDFEKNILLIQEEIKKSERNKKLNLFLSNIEFFDIYEFEYDNCGRNCNYLKVATLPFSDKIYAMYPEKKLTYQISKTKTEQNLKNK